MDKKADIAIIGLAVMGENLVLNFESRGFTVAVYNRTWSRTDAFLQDRAKDKNIIGLKKLEEMVESLALPRKVLLMIKAGPAVDSVIEQLVPLLDKGDIIIDGGNSHYPDTQRRMEDLGQKGILYCGCGISGGEEGALKGPSMMPGGNPDSWKSLEPLLTSIAAKAPDGQACSTWIGNGGAGHFVKMVHNGIEYGYMQLITEIYQIMKQAYKWDNKTIGSVFKKWNENTDLSSYLIEITSRIFTVNDEDGSLLVDKIADRAGQKGTGKWTVMAALEEGIPLGVISESVFARSLSAQGNIREKTGTGASLPQSEIPNPAEGEKLLYDALLAAKIIDFAQGFTLIQEASRKYGWEIRKGEVAMIWRNGCIIRSALLENIKQAFDRNPELPSLLQDEDFGKKIASGAEALRKVTAQAITAGIPIPSLSAAVNYLHAVKAEQLPVNLLQAQRDFFGAHTYERTDKPEGEFFHTDWYHLS